MDKHNFFEAYFNNAQVNSIIILDSNGIILEVNPAFTNNFGYVTEELKGKNFRELFNSTGKEKNIPEQELEIALKTGQANDESFLIDKNGNEVWCSGEAVRVPGVQGEQYIVKDIINLQARKQVNLFLNDTEELLERIFEASKDIPMMILDGSMKIQKVNTAFLDFFEISKPPKTYNGLSSLNHPFWVRPEVRSEISNVVVKNKPMKGKMFQYQTKSGEQKTLLLDSKVIYLQPEKGRKIFIIIDHMTAENSIGPGIESNTISS
jgi:PAS domain S-box-containing protein